MPQIVTSPQPSKEAYIESPGTDFAVSVVVYSLCGSRFTTGSNDPGNSGLDLEDDHIIVGEQDIVGEMGVDGWN